MPKIALVIAQEGYQTKEYSDAKHVLENAGNDVVTVSMKDGVAVSNIGEHIVVDKKVADLDAADIDALYAIGGPGAPQSLDNESVHKLFADFMNKTDKPYGAICISPRILAKAGVLRGVKATGWNADGKLEDILRGAGATYVREPVVDAGRVITADGPSSAAAWGEAIAKSLLRKM